MILETERLVLEPWQSEDWVAFRPIATDPAVMRYITGGTPWSDEQIQGFVERQMRALAERGFCRWRLSEKPDRALIGFCGADRWRDAVDLEIGWWLAPQYWGRGLATEAATAALRDVFERAGLARVMSVTVPANTASQRVMRKIGLTLEGEFESEGVRFLRHGMDRDGYAARYAAPGDVRWP